MYILLLIILDSACLLPFKLTLFFDHLKWFHWGINAHRNTWQMSYIDFSFIYTNKKKPNSWEIQLILKTKLAFYTKIKTRNLKWKTRTK